jgi:hypothetical protein
MMFPAQWDREFVTDLAAESAVLRESQTMGVARLTSADQTSLLGDIAHVIAIASLRGSPPSMASKDQS